MEYLNLHTSVLDNEILATAEDGPRSTWLHLMRYCIGQENGGRISGAKSWNARKWLLLCRVPLASTEVPSLLWTWEADELVVWGYPHEHQRAHRAKRKAARDTNRRRWQSGSHSDTPPASHSDSLSDPSTASHSESINKGKVKEGNIEREGKWIKPSLSDVQHYAQSISLSDFEAQTFFDHYEANGWKQGGRTPLRSWPAALRNWQRKAPRFGKNSSGEADGAGGSIPFNPNGPNAHTGGAAEIR